MPAKLPLHLYRETTRHGRAVYYVRVGHGPRTRIAEDYDTDAFWDAYRAALTGKQPPKQQGPETGSLAWLIGKYVESAEWSELSAATRKQRHTVYRIIEGTAGTRPARGIQKNDILASRDHRRDKPHAANNYVKAMRGLFGWAMDRNYVPADPTKGVKLLAGKNDDAGFHAWTEDECARFEAKYPVGTRPRLAFDVLLYTGLCRGDAVRLGQPHVRNGEFTIRTEKTGAVVIAPILPQLAASIAATQTGELTFICTERGKPFTKESFGTWFGKICRAARCPGSAHGLRKAGARRAAEEGATEAQLNALFGWADGSRESATYTKTANRAKLAREARKSAIAEAEKRTSDPALSARKSRTSKKLRIIS
ncbi:hypothetical protein MGN01_31070 [Methylobacterium gnaphalii]|uniref:Tyr recombinase domain-containing protein n=2 Tax=Methylobacterium gnaphalii TaxID=1010610 RepID=A0A512JMV2_9HYPH|nr:hypothetical protein MGN01_31070 [Methylobacterium gnaphalii]